MSSLRSCAALVTLTVLASSAGCGDDTTTDGSGGGGAASASSGSTSASTPTATATATSSTSTGAGGDDTGTGGAFEGELIGSIIATAEAYEVDGNPTIYSSVTAYLAEYSRNPFEGLCDVEAMGPCAVAHCDGVEGEGEEVIIRSVDAGPISFEGGLVDAVLEVQPDGSYGYFSSSTQLLYEGGEDLVISAPGAIQVPDFRFEVVAPTPIDVVEPPLTGDELSITGDALEVAWSGGTSGSVTVYLSTVRYDGDDLVEQVNVSCTFDADAGEGTVPASALAALLPTGATVQGYASIGVYAAQVEELGTGAVELRAYNRAYSEGTDTGAASAELLVE